MNHVKEIKLIACDMDGTFLDPEHEIREENIKAVTEVRKRNVEFIIVRYSISRFERSISSSRTITGNGKKSTIGARYCRKKVLRKRQLRSISQRGTCV